MSIKELRAEIGAVRFYWAAFTVIMGWGGHADRGPEWTFWRGLREIAKSMRRLHRGELKPMAPAAWGKTVDVRDFLAKRDQP